MKRSRFRRSLAIWWWSVASLTLVTFVLALWSFPAYLTPPDQPPPSPLSTLSDSLYHTLQLFVLGWETTPQPVSWQLHLARLLAAGVALSTVIVALFQVFRERMALFLLRRSHNHVVMCGLGERGVELVEDLRTRGHNVVVIEEQEDHPDLPICRELAPSVLIASPTDPWVLGQARVDRAATLLSLYQQDADSIEALMKAQHLNAKRSQEPLRCILQVFDHDLQWLLRKQGNFEGSHGPIRLDLFNLYDIGAQVMLRESPVLYQPVKPRRLLVVGAGWLGQRLVDRLISDWYIDRLSERLAGPGSARKPETLEVIAVDPKFGSGQLPRTSNDPTPAGVNLVPVPMDVQGDEFQKGEFLQKRETGNTIDAAFICLPDDRLALLTAVRLRERFGPQLPLVVRMTSRTGTAELLTARAIEKVHVVGLFDLASTMPLVSNATIELLAREIHRDYVLDQFARNQAEANKLALVPWHLLNEEMRDSNRQAAAHIETKLDAIGCEKVPVHKIDSLFQFDDKDVDTLAAMEHDRWYQERVNKGWKYNATMDKAIKLSPYLVPYNQLPDDVKDFNRATMQRIPVWLAKAGFGIRRLPK